MLDKESAFTRELIDEVARNHYSLRAWRTLLSRSWIRSLEDIRNSPARTQSFWSWVVIVAAMGASIILLTLWLRTTEQALTALALWLPWFAGTVFFGLTHLGMVDDRHGVPHQSLLLPNGLSFIRLALAPLVLWPCLQVPIDPVAGPIFALFLAGLSLSDLLDGWIARRQNLCTRMGGMLDYLADVALLTFLATGLYLAGAIPGSLLLLLVVRYPILLIGVFIIYFVRGPRPLQPTLIGKATTFATSVVLLVIAANSLLLISWPTPLWIEWCVRLLYILIGVNILYLINQGVAWASRRENPGSSSG
jgi:cardiolipin synthase